MAMGMNYLHLCSIMHRDLKSGNVLIDSRALPISVQVHFRRLPARYALSVNPDDVPLHMRLLAQNQRDPTAIAVNAQLKKDDNGEIVPNVCEVVVCH
ncbi:unnamed protein product [Peronospora destructor]|uniref:Protein kinase domain-containing protein n=1 Tax=Peronospora destructor TaxID=86335 RepID=A0AAV0SX22_9STRA|nr:unnamed protein product [Peronospora destructor]